MFVGPCNSLALLIRWCKAHRAVCVVLSVASAVVWIAAQVVYYRMVVSSPSLWRAVAGDEARAAVPIGNRALLCRSYSFVAFTHTTAYLVHAGLFVDGNSPVFADKQAGQAMLASQWMAAWHGASESSPSARLSHLLADEQFLDDKEAIKGIFASANPVAVTEIGLGPPFAWRVQVGPNSSKSGGPAGSPIEMGVHWSGLVLHACASAASALGVMSCVVVWRAKRWLRAGCCDVCGYLLADMCKCCPECGGARHPL